MRQFYKFFFHESPFLWGYTRAGLGNGVIFCFLIRTLLYISFDTPVSAPQFGIEEQNLPKEKVVTEPFFQKST
jgi:hypothetical protein